MSRTPLKRMGTAREIGDAVAFLASPKAGYITGETICVDGGRLGLNYVVREAAGEAKVLGGLPSSQSTVNGFALRETVASRAFDVELLHQDHADDGDRRGHHQAEQPEHRPHEHLH